MLMATCTSDFECVQEMQHKPQRGSFDLGKRDLCQVTLLQAPKQQASEELRPGGQEGPIGVHKLTVLACESDIPESAAIQQLTAVTDQLCVLLQSCVTHARSQY